MSDEAANLLALSFPVDIVARAPLQVRCNPNKGLEIKQQSKKG